MQYQNSEDERNMGVYQNIGIRPACSLFFLSLAECILKAHEACLMLFLLFLLFRAFLPNSDTAAQHDRSVTVASDLLLSRSVKSSSLSRFPVSSLSCRVVEGNESFDS